VRRRSIKSDTEIPAASETKIKNVNAATEKLHSMAFILRLIEQYFV